MIQSTIAAIATPYGKGAISIIRISGSEAITLSSKLFKIITWRILNLTK
jgi:tRNA modification GTPase